MTERALRVNQQHVVVATDLTPESIALLESTRWHHV